MGTNYRAHFVEGQRDSGVRFITLADDRPEWLHGAVQEAHAGDMPNVQVPADGNLTFDVLNPHVTLKAGAPVKNQLQLSG